VRPIRTSFLRVVAVSVGIALTGCASAEKRLEQGMEEEEAGNFYAASLRYIEALEKDNTLAEARDRLIASGEAAIVDFITTWEERTAAGDPVGGAQPFFTADGLIARSGAVGVRLPRPDDYPLMRRDAFDAAIEQHMANGDDAAEQGDWSSGQQAYVRARSTGYEPSPEQIQASVAAETVALVDWAHAEEAAERFRRAYGLAEQALALSEDVPDDLADAAVALQDRAVELGTRGMVAFPVTSTAAVRDVARSDVEQQLADVLELEHWRQPPPFIAVADPVLVRQVTRRYTRPGETPRLGLVMDEMGAEFGALIELVALTATEGNVQPRTREARTTSGVDTSYVEESGTLTLTGEVHVIIVDRRGTTVTEFTTQGSEGGSFRRGVYAGDVSDLELSRNEQRLFDPSVLDQESVRLEEIVVAGLAGRVAGQVFQRVLQEIP